MEILDVPNLDSFISTNQISMNNNIILLPDNYNTIKDSSEAIFSSTTQTLKQLLNINSIKVNIPYDENKLILMDKRNNEWFGPILLFSTSILTQDPNLLSVTLGVISNYLTDIFKGTATETDAHLNIILYDENSKKAKEIKYKGPIKGIKEITKTAKELSKSLHK
jgi:hypothetical protein